MKKHWFINSENKKLQLMPLIDLSLKTDMITVILNKAQKETNWNIVGGNVNYSRFFQTTLRKSNRY